MWWQWFAFTTAFIAILCLMDIGTKLGKIEERIKDFVELQKEVAYASFEDDKTDAT